MCRGIVLIFPVFFPLDREVFWVFCITLLRVLLLFFLFYRKRGWGFSKELDIESSEYSGTNISGGEASVIPNEALPHIGRHTTA